MKRAAMFAGLLGVIFISTAFQSQQENPVDKYALLVIAASETNSKITRNLDPIDVNCELVGLARIYKVLKNSGYNDANIYILYGENGQQPNWKEKENAQEVKEIKETHFSKPNWKKPKTVASKGNVNKIVKDLKKKIDDNDRFIFYLLTHGQPGGAVQLSDGGWTSAEIQKTFKGFKNRTNILIFETCFSGGILDNTRFDNAVSFAASTSSNVGWTDRTFANGVNFLEALANKECDEDKDGIVEAKEAFKHVKKLAKEYRPKLKKYFKKYRPPRPVPPGTLESVNLVPKMKVGKNYVEANLN